MGAKRPDWSVFMSMNKEKNAMRISELDVVKLKDGRSGTVLEVLEAGEIFLVEIVDGRGRTQEMPTVKADEIEQVTWSNN